MVSLREMVRADAERVLPAWLRPLLEAKFFEACPEHPDASRATRSGGCNLFCTVCTGRPLCHACVAGDHAGHQLIQVRRSSKHNVVKMKNVEALLDVDEVQPYLINCELVVSLNPSAPAGRSAMPASPATTPAELKVSAAGMHPWKNEVGAVVSCSSRDMILTQDF